jgi:pSer/pThr/pTyr-binding forkhead associated (FHA) protein
MIEVSVTYPTPEGSQEIPVRGRLSFGRGSEADQRFADDGLSRLHATIYEDDGRVWIVDENSSNGTFVNGSPVQSGGTPIRHGDSIKIGHRTVLMIRIAEIQAARQPAAKVHSVMSAQSRPTSGAMSIIPIALIACTILIVSVSAVFIGFKVLGSSKPEVVRQADDEFEDIDTKPARDIKGSPTPRSGESPAVSKSDETIITDSPQSDSSKPAVAMPPGKKYLDLLDSEKRQ